MSATTKPTEASVVPTTTEGVRDLLRRAAKGDASTLPAVRKMLENPAYVDLLGGDLAQTARGSFVRALAGDDLAVREALYAKMDSLRSELLAGGSSPVERLLAERVVACWLQAHDADARAAQAQKDMSLRQADFHQRRMDATHRRYLSALKALALVRKLAVPVVQLNIARKQVNVAAPAVVAAPAAITTPAPG